MMSLGASLLFFIHLKKHVQSQETCPSDLGSAESKLSSLWDNVLSTVYDPSTDRIPEIDALTAVNPWKTKHSFIDCGDTMLNGRQKAIHQRGLVFQAKYVPTDNALGYTGIFAQGSEYALGRFSYPLPPKQENGTVEVITGFALKFLLDNQPSVNMFAMHSLDAQPTFNLFAQNISNALPPSSSLLKVLSQSFRAAKYLALDRWYASADDTDPMYLSLDPLSKTNEDENGKHKAPFAVVCVPSAEIKALYHSTGLDIDTTDFRVMLNGKARNTKIFNVFAEATKIGDIYAVSDFVASSFGDQQLFFQHPL